MKIKKIVSLMLALAMVVSGLYIITPDAGEVKAADTTQSQSNTIVPNVVADGMLNVKMQIQTNQGSAKYADGSVNLRLVSSVNGLGYRNVGFEVCLDVNNDGEFDKTSGSSEYIKFTAGSVAKRIDATVTGVTYNYSPKVIDTDAEYFVSGTLMGINKDHLSKDMYARAFCTTMDGKVEYGTARYFNIKDATANNIINIPVAMDAAPDMANTVVKIDGTETTATLEKYDDAGYAHVNVVVPSGNKTGLPSASKVEVGTESAIYRNLESSYSGEGTEDISWYEEYLTENPDETKFIIATAADLYGLSTLGKTNTFAGKTIYMVKDIDANEGDAAATGFTAKNGTTLYDWTPIGGISHSGNGFQGTFDGQMHKISGLHFSASATATVCYGLFGKTAGATIQRFTLDNSYMFIEGNTSQNIRLGCVGGYAVGGSKFDTIKVTNTVYAKNEAGKGNSSGHGGIIGYIDSTGAQITNCWFDGQFTGGAGGIGGMVGSVKSAGDTQIKNCLYTGKLILATAGNIVGGVCGNVSSSKLTIEDSLSMGTLDLATYSVTTNNRGALIGYGSGLYSGESYVATINNTYALISTTWNNYVTTGSAKFNVDGQETSGSILQVAIDINRYVEAAFCTGETGYVNMNLDFTIGDDYAGHWSTTATGTPVLSSFVDAEDMLELDEVKTARTVWYDEAASDATEYTLYSMADMFGFVSLADDTFTGKIVKLGTDITMNKGTADATGFMLDTEEQTTLNPWTPRDMAGTFDGDGHTIRGVYLNTATGNAGLFASVTGTVKDLRLCNSYINCTNNTANNYASTNWLLGAGSIAGSLSGTLDTVYSDAIVIKTGAYVGGLVGTVYDATTDSTGTSTITNSCFAGKVQGHHVVGGLVGVVVTTATIDHCLNAGTVTANDLFGGLCAEVWTGGNLTVNDSLNVGRSSNSTIAWSGGMVGYVRGVPVSLNNTYTIMYFENVTGNWKNSVYRSSTGTLKFDGAASTRQDEAVNGWTEQAVLNKVNISGVELGLSFQAEESGADNSQNYWVARDGKIPMLESFEDLLTNVTY